MSVSPNKQFGDDFISHWHCFRRSCPSKRACGRSRWSGCSTKRTCACRGSAERNRARVPAASCSVAVGSISPLARWGFEEEGAGKTR